VTFILRSAGKHTTSVLTSRWNPKSLGSRLIAWHDASSLRIGDTFVTLPDLSGNGNTWTVTPAKVAPTIVNINNLASISAVAANTALSEAGTPIVYDDWVLLAVVKPSITGQRALMSTRGAAFPVGGTTAYVGTNGQLFTYLNNSSPPSHIGPTFTTSQSIFEYRFQLSGTTHTVNGGTPNFSARTNCKIWAAGSNNRWFSDLELPGEIWNGELCEAIRIESPTADDLSNARAYLRNKWGTELTPPQIASMKMWMDSDSGLTKSGNLIDSWASRVGGFVFFNSGTARPVHGQGYIEFDGTDDALIKTCDANSHPVSLTKFSFATWARRDANKLAIIYSSTPFGSGTGILLQDNQTFTRQAGLGAGHSISGFLPLGEWVFRAMTYDASKPAGTRTSVYEGTSPATLALITPNSDSTFGPGSVAVNTSAIGYDVNLGRHFKGRINSMYYYADIELTLPELKTLAELKMPPTKRPPQYDSLITWLDPNVGIVSSSGLVDSWTSRVGTAVYTSSTTLRPILGNGYLEFDPNVFKGKTVLLPCDDPEWSNFTKFFSQNFERFGLKKLISTSYAVESKNNKVVTFLCDFFLFSLSAILYLFLVCFVCFFHQNKI
jgi:hypothetical protein